MRNFVGSRAIPQIEYHRATELEQALDLLKRFKGRCKVIAGGTDLIPAFRTGRISLPEGFHIIDISSVKELDYIAKDDGMIRIGAITRVSAIGASPVVKEHVPILADAASQLGSLQIRNQATIGGNLCNASPAADTAPPLLVLDAKVNVRGIDGQRLVPLREFFTAPGKTILASSEILVEVQIPVPESTADSCFIKLGRRNAFTLSIVSVATLVKVKSGFFDDIRIALGAVAPTPIRALKAEEHLTRGKVTEQAIDEGAKVVASEVAPIDDVRASTEYRRDMSYVLTKRAISFSVQRAGG